MKTLLVLATAGLLATSAWADDFAGNPDLYGSILNDHNGPIATVFASELQPVPATPNSSAEFSQFHTRALEATTASRALKAAHSRHPHMKVFISNAHPTTRALEATTISRALKAAHSRHPHMKVLFNSRLTR